MEDTIIRRVQSVGKLSVKEEDIFVWKKRKKEKERKQKKHTFVNFVGRFTQAWRVSTITIGQFIQRTKPHVNFVEKYLIMRLR